MQQDSPEAEARRPISPIAGPYGHPFHPLFVTIPIGAWVASLVFDIVSRVNDDGAPSLVDASYWLILLGIVGALVAAIFGLMDLASIPRRTRAFTTGLTHMTINLVVVVLFAVNFAWRSSDHTEALRTTGGQLVLSIIALLLLSVSGWLGGRLAYRYGVRVADLSTQHEGFTRVGRVK
jgi:uncharacterized membrane protein